MEVEAGRGLAPAGASEDELASLAASARIVSEQVESYFLDLPDGYKADEGARAKSDSWTYGEIATADVLKLAAQVPDRRNADFIDLGSGIGKMTLAAGRFFRRAVGVEISADRTAVGLAACAKATPEERSNVELIAGDFLKISFREFRVVFTHNIVFSSGLQRQMQLKFDRELTEGARQPPQPGTVIFSVVELKYAKRARLTAEHSATYNWAENGESRPLYQYVIEGEPLQPGSDEEDD